MVRSSDVPAVTPDVASYDSFATIPEYSAIHDALTSGDGQRFEALLAELAPPEAAYAISLLSGIDGIEQLLAEVVEERPASSAARTALAMRYVAIGWTMRTSKWAQDVSREQFEQFRQWLIIAEQQLIAVCALPTPYAPAWGARVLTARALEVGPSEARRRFRRLAELSADDLPAQINMLQYLLPRWHGSVEEAHAFVRQTVDSAPAGSHSGALVPIFHIERWVELGAEEGRAHLSNPDVLAEIRAAAERSVLDRHHLPGAIGVQAHSAFAMAYWLAGWNDGAAVHMRILGDRASEYPWKLALAAPGAIAAVRAEVLRGTPAKESS